MNWEAIASISEVVGAIAVVITLIYLAIQTRLTRSAVEENSQHLLQQATHSAVGMYSDWRRSILGSPEIASIIVRARTNGELLDDEHLLYSICFQDLFLAAATAYRSVVHDTSGHDEAVDVAYMVSVLKDNQLAVEEWENVAPVVTGISKEFVEAVNSGLSQAPERPLDEQAVNNRAPRLL